MFGKLILCRTMRRKLVYCTIITVMVGLLVNYKIHTHNFTLPITHDEERQVTEYIAENIQNTSTITSNTTHFDNKSTPETLYPWMRIREKRVTSFNYVFLSSPKGLCTEPPHIIITCLTQYQSIARRKAIRETWGSLANKTHSSFRIVFLIGKPESDADRDIVFKENLKFNDILQMDFQDTYRNLTVKVLMGLKWVSLNCPEANFVLKIDDDTFVNLPALVTRLKKYTVTEKGLLLGTLKRKAKVLRTGKFALSKKLYPAIFFPTYLSGQAYLVSGNIAAAICNVSEYFPYFFIEDAFITGHVREVLDIKMVHLNGFPSAKKVSPGPCTFYVGDNVAHSYASVEDMYTVWHSLYDKGVETCCKKKKTKGKCNPNNIKNYREVFKQANDTRHA